MLCFCKETEDAWESINGFVMIDINMIDPTKVGTGIKKPDYFSEFFLIKYLYRHPFHAKTGLLEQNWHG